MANATESKDVEYDIDVQKNYWKFWNTRDEYPHERALRRGEKIQNYLKSLGLEQPQLMDLGCGNGWFANQLAEYGPTTAIDLSDEAIEQAKSQFPRVDFRAGDVLEMDFPDATYDVVVSQEVIAHVPRQSDYISLAARILKPNGHLIITTPNRFVHDRIDWPEQPPGHIEKWLARKELFSLLRPEFRVLQWTTAVPLGDRGLLRFVNSHRLNRVAQIFASPDRLQKMKEWAGFGWSLIVLAQKRPESDR